MDLEIKKEKTKHDWLFLLITDVWNLKGVC